MREYTRPLPPRPRGAGGPTGHDHADETVDDLVDRRTVGAVGHLLAQADDGVVPIGRRDGLVFHRGFLQLLPKTTPARRSNLGSLLITAPPQSALSARRSIRASRRTRWRPGATGRAGHRGGADGPGPGDPEGPGGRRERRPGGGDVVDE